jgi:hypothetical protein
MTQEPRIVGARVMVEGCLFLNAAEFPQRAGHEAVDIAE